MWRCPALPAVNPKQPFPERSVVDQHYCGGPVARKRSTHRRRRQPQGDEHDGEPQRECHGGRKQPFAMGRATAGTLDPNSAELRLLRVFALG